MRRFTSMTRIVMGENALSTIAEEALAYGKKALVVTDKGVRMNGLLDPILSTLSSAGVEVAVFDDVVSNPTIANVEEAVRAQQQSGSEVIIAVGGGSPMDTAKAAAMLATNGGHIRDYEGFDKFANPILPLLTVPTTVGTGSEVTKGAVISDPDRHAKMVVASDLLYPEIAFLDPRMVAGLPAPVCAATGIDALTHAIEGYVSRGANAFTDGLNLHAIKLIAEHLRPAVAGHRQSLYQMLVASCLAGVGFHNAGLGLVHAMANTMGGHFNIHHGVANAILLPHVMEFNLIAQVNKFADIAEAMGENVDGITRREAAAKAIAAVKQLMVDVGVPLRLRDAGITEDAIERMALESLNAIDRPGNPRNNNQKDIESLYRAAF
ncbi:iron-containing alcohol dehydrogenase [Paenibacillaceae bacterium WGS1546]|uniref:iron-containing alcohol dehydrogenase n=1 Tax=Cohnella sp. WGS1546 TaxID=3366810 RepID=UPI00372D4D7C